jgi:hypothetical protein
MLVSLFSGIYSFISKLSISPSTPTNPKNPFSASFIIKNESALAIHDIDFGYMVDHIKDKDGHEWLSGEPTLKWESVPPIDIINAGESTTLHLPPLLGNEPITVAELKINVKYRASFTFRSHT